MTSMVRLAGLATLLCIAVPVGFAKTPVPASKSGTIVIVFKDGHRQSFNLSDVLRVEFPAAGEASSAAAPSNPMWPSRGHFLGKWEVGDGSGTTFYITLEDNGEAKKSMGDAHGRWVYVDGEARVSWDDGWQDAIRKVGSRFQKFAYSSGKSFTDMPDNVTAARNTMPHPI
jgi:hypothetical protein